jgi:Putative binding domain, N-terminal/Viral BACON domain
VGWSARCRTARWSTRCADRSLQVVKQAWKKKMRTISHRHFASILALSLAPLACAEKSATEPAPVCTFTLSATSLTVPAEASSASVTVETAAHCNWTVTSDRGWMSVNGLAARTGPGVASATLTDNTSESSRTGTLSIAGQTVAVSQNGVAPPCTFRLEPGSASWPHEGGSGTFSVVTAERCVWSAHSNAAWITVTSGQQGTGKGTVSYAVERNRDVAARAGTVTAADQTFNVTESGEAAALNCEYSVVPIEFNVCMAVPSTLTAAINTEQGCSWTAAPDASWVTVTGGQSGTGPGTISFRVSDNWDVSRRANVMVRWPTPTAGQNMRVAQAGCRYAVSSSAISISAGGNSARFDVIQQSDPLECGGPLQNGCVWRADANVPWITITTSMPQAGDSSVAFTVAANEGAAPRTGTITVRDKVVVVTQSGR